MRILWNNSLKALLAQTFVVTAGLYWVLPAERSENEIEAAQPDTAAIRRQCRTMISYLEFARPRDTVYVLGDRYLEVSLKEQRVAVRYRNGDTAVFPISSGNPDVKDGMATSTGIFSVQARTPVAFSKQFGNTKMLWWIGFNYNIGFHGLEANGYYRHLGKRPSSHGCLRMGREDVAELYKRVREGTPVIVHDTPPARVLAFADDNFDEESAFRLATPTREWGKFTQKLMRRRFECLLNGTRLARQPFSVYLDGATQLRPGGFETGDETALVVPQQKPILFPSLHTVAAQDNIRRRTRHSDAMANGSETVETADNAREDSTVTAKNAR